MENRKAPRISIGIPVYNGENFIKEAIDSVLNQTFDDFELIISDNASIDSTEKICREYAAKDQRVRYHRHEQNRGPAWNHNYLVKVARGEFFKWNSHDDFCSPNFLEQSVKELDQDPSIILCHAKTAVINSVGEVLDYYNPQLRTNSPKPVERFHDLLFGGHCYEIYGLIRLSALKKTSLIGYYAHGDGVLLVKLALQGSFYELPDYLHFYRRHEQQSIAIAEKDYRQYTGWFDPAKKGKISLPRWKIFFEYCAAWWTSPLGLRDRVQCMRVLVKWFIRKRHRMWEDLRVAVSQLIRRFLSSTTLRRREQY